MPRLYLNMEDSFCWLLLCMLDSFITMFSVIELSGLCDTWSLEMTMSKMSTHVLLPDYCAMCNTNHHVIISKTLGESILRKINGIGFAV